MQHPGLPLYFFGTLCDHDVLGLVVNRPMPESALRPALLPGHAVVRYPQASYPMLVARSGASAHGRLLTDYADEDLQRILFFESDEYTLQEISVVEPGGLRTRALVFSEVGRVSDAVEPWDLGTWQATDKGDFLTLTATFMAWCGHGTLEEAEAAWREAEQELLQPTELKQAQR